MELFDYAHVARNISVSRATGPYYLPKKVAEAVDFVGGFLRFPRSIFMFRCNFDGGLN